MVVLTSVIVPYIKSKTTAQQQEDINGWVMIAVSAAEQIFTGRGRGQEKKQFVLEWLFKHGFSVDPEVIDTLIESAVYELKNGIIA